MHCREKGLSQNIWPLFFNQLNGGRGNKCSKRSNTAITYIARGQRVVPIQIFLSKHELNSSICFVFNLSGIDRIKYTILKENRRNYDIHFHQRRLRWMPIRNWLLQFLFSPSLLGSRMEKNELQKYHTSIENDLTNENTNSKIDNDS